MRYDLSDCSNLHLILSAELNDTRRRVAGLLLHFHGGEAQHHLSKSEIATTLGTSWDMVNNSLVSLKQEGALRIDRHRMAINKEILERILISNN